MAQTKRLPDAELEVMQTIWTLTPPVTAAEVQQHAAQDRHAQPQPEGDAQVAVPGQDLVQVAVDVVFMDHQQIEFRHTAQQQRSAQRTQKKKPLPRLRRV